MSKVIKINGLDKWRNKLGQLDKKVHDVVVSNIGLAGLEIAEDANSRAPSGLSNELARSYRYNLSKDGLSVAVGSDLQYAAFVEFGTRSKVQIPSDFADLAARFRGGKGGTFESLLAQIKLWCKAKGIEQEAAYPIALKIARYGTEARPHFIIALRAGIIRFIENLKTNLGKEINK